MIEDNPPGQTATARTTATRQLKVPSIPSRAQLNPLWEQSILSKRYQSFMKTALGAVSQWVRITDRVDGGQGWSDGFESGIDAPF